MLNTSKPIETDLVITERGKELCKPLVSQLNLELGTHTHTHTHPHPHKHTHSQNNNFIRHA